MKKINDTSKRLHRWVGMLIALVLAVFAGEASAGTYTLTNVWNVAAGVEGQSTGADGGNRSVAYNAISNQVFASYRAGSSNLPIMVFDGTSGAWISGASGVTGSLGLNCDQIGVGDDGVLYGCPLNTSVTASSAFKVYSWSSWNTANVLAFSSGATDPIVTTVSGTKRVGDSFAVTGAGTNTLILAGIGGSGAFALLSVSNGVFVSTVLTNSSIGALPNVCGLAFYTNNTFILKASGNAFLIQFPTNFASLPSPVTTTVLGSAALTGTTGDTSLSYSSAGQLLAANSQAGTSTSPAILFSTTNYPTAASSVTSVTISTPNANGNATGGIALGGAGKTNFMYVLDTDNGLHAYQINYSAGAIGPVISAPSGGVTNAYPPQTLSVTVTSGTAPFFYQWYSITATSTNAISGATNSSYTATTPVTNLYYVVVTNAAATANVVTSSVVGLTLLPPVTNSVVSQLWSVGVSTYTFLANDNDSRGIGYDTNLNEVIVTSTTGSASVNLLNGNTGASNGTFSLTGMYTGATFTVDQVGAADDGLVYVGNLAVAGQTYELTQFPSAINGATGVTAFEGDPGNGSGDRWGDTMAVRGAGVNTQVLLGAKSSANVALLTTTDGTHFQSTLMTISGVPSGFVGNGGIAFGAGNTFWAKEYGGDLYEVAYDPVALTNGVVFDYSISGQIPSRLIGLAVDMTNNILAGVNVLDQNNDLQLFELTGSANPPVLFEQAFFPAFNANGNDNAAVVMKRFGNTNRVYALDVDNGIVALTYGVPSSTAPTITTDPSSVTVFSADNSLKLSVGVSGSLPIYYQWQLNGTNIPNATNSSFVFTNLSTNQSGNYDVVVHNISGSQTSTAATVTIEPPVTSAHVTQLWNITAGGTNFPYQNDNTGSTGALTNYPYLDTTTYSARGLAYDTNTSTVVVANDGAALSGAYLGLFVVDADTGTNMFTLNTLGLPTVGVLFALDQVGIADDGAVYAANLTAAGSATNFSVFTWGNVSTGAFPSYAMQSTDPGNGSGDRWGDSMAVRGAGLNTQILLGTYAGFDGGPATNAALLTTTGGGVFTPLLLSVTNAVGVPSGFSMLGIAFGSGNTFWTKSPGFDLREIAFDPVSGNCSLLQDISLASSGYSSFNNLGALCLDVPNSLMAGVAFGDTPGNVAFYQLGNTGMPPYLFNQSFFPTVQANGQNNGAVSVKGNRVYALDNNNGIVALAYTVPPAPPTQTAFIITSISNTVGGVVLTWHTQSGFTYQVQTAPALPGTIAWVNLGAPVVANGTTATYTDTTVNASVATSFYRVIGY